MATIVMSEADYRRTKEIRTLRRAWEGPCNTLDSHVPNAPRRMLDAMNSTVPGAPCLSDRQFGLAAIGNVKILHAMNQKLLPIQATRALREFLHYCERSFNGFPVNAELRQELLGHLADHHRRLTGSDNAAPLGPRDSLELALCVGASTSGVEAAYATETFCEDRAGIYPGCSSAQFRGRHAKFAGFRAKLLHRLFGATFDLQVAIDPRWMSETVVALTTGIKRDGAYDRLPILADGLEDVGCDCLPLLTSLRQSTALTAEGYWGLDLLSGEPVRLHYFDADPEVPASLESPASPWVFLTEEEEEFLQRLDEERTERVRRRLAWAL